jgi:acetyl esterase/lipase
MINDMIKLREYFPDLPGDYDTTLTAYCPYNSPEIKQDRKRVTIVLCPGGAYEFISDREAEPVALQLMALGFNVFLLRYGVMTAKYPEALLEAAASVAYIRANADRFSAHKDKIVIMGFSAGGHLAASLGVFWKEPFIASTLHVDNDAVRPNGMILGYPVISSGEFAHRGSFDALLGDQAPKELMDKMSLENQVNADTPPAFLWHTFEDGSVPLENSMLFAAAMRRNHISFELHVYPLGNHGLSLCTDETSRDDSQLNPHASTWFKLCGQWLKLTFGE